MQTEPKLTVSGYRGVWQVSLTNEVVENYTLAFIKFIKENINDNPTILIGRDGRESGPVIKETIIKTLNILGINFIDGDILPTPTVLFAVKKHKYDGAIIITASHNPREYNGLKFVTDKALFTNEEEVEKIKNNYEEIVNKKLPQNIPSGSTDIFLLKNSSCSRRRAPKSSIRNILFSFFKNNIFPQDFNLPQEHADQILKNINVEKIHARKFKVAVDMINASA